MYCPECGVELADDEVRQELCADCLVYAQQLQEEAYEYDNDPGFEDDMFHLWDRETYDREEE